VHVRWCEASPVGLLLTVSNFMLHERADPEPDKARIGLAATQIKVMS